jgi:SEC-C motif-containing protein
MPQNHQPFCHCGSGQKFADCCQPLLDQQQASAETALALMRSRYTAYVLHRSDYLLATWAPETKPAALNLENERVQWLGLKIHRCLDGLATDSEGEVEFTAAYLTANILCTMHEVSRFIRFAGRWYYVDGKCEMMRTKSDRNAPCPCGSGRKFKRCCGSK